MRSRIAYICFALMTAMAAVIFIVTMIEATDPGALPDAPPANEVLSSLSLPRATTTSALPVRLAIPSIGIDARVQSVGVTASGNMASPKGFSDVGWYKYGTIPGNLGSAVIAGHVDNGLSLAGVFKHLDQVKAGDDIYVTDERGERLRFVVDSVESFDYKNVPLDRLFARDDRARLNLITCDGAWVGPEKTYDKRLVVFASFM